MAFAYNKLLGHIFNFCKINDENAGNKNIGAGYISLVSAVSITAFLPAFLDLPYIMDPS